MEIDVVEASPAEVAADVLAFAVPEPIELQSAGQELDRLVDGGIQHLIEDGHGPLPLVDLVGGQAFDRFQR